MVREQLKGKNIVITGASGGIGAEIAKLCAESGANLVLLARSVDKLKQLQINLEEYHHIQVDVFKLDVSDTDQIKEVFEQIFEQIGDIDILVNNAGFGVFREAHEATLDEMKGMFNVNVIGLMACTSMVLPKMRERRFGQAGDAKVECLFGYKACCSRLYKCPENGA